MIGLYWMVIPVMLLHFYANLPMAQYNQLRSWIVTILTWIWSIRMIHSYFRRENWQLGVKQDWRYTDMSNQYGKNWWWISFFAIYLSQQVSFKLRSQTHVVYILPSSDSSIFMCTSFFMWL